jgi:hypothetical protein
MALGPLRRKLDPLVQVLDLALQLLGGDVRLAATRGMAPVFLAEAVEVDVLALGALDGEAAATDGAQTRVPFR